MPQISIADETLARLQKYAVPLIDNFDSLLNRVLDAYETNGQTDEDTNTTIQAATTKMYDALSPPDLTHTKVLSASINGSSLAKGANWNGLLKQMVVMAAKRSRSADDLKNSIIVNYAHGKKDDDGYEYLPDADLSVQGQDANAAWRGISHLAQQLGLAVEVSFMWRQKDKAAYPGEVGRFAITQGRRP